MKKFNNGNYDGYATSKEILAAIEQVAGVEIPVSASDERNNAYRVWAQPTAEEVKSVQAIAFSKTEEDSLRWGLDTVTRN